MINQQSMPLLFINNNKIKSKFYFMFYSGCFSFKEILNAADSSHFKQMYHYKNELESFDPINIQFTSVIIFQCRHIFEYSLKTKTT
jgi:hypothetical protein